MNGCDTSALLSQVQSLAAQVATYELDNLLSITVTQTSNQRAVQPQTSFTSNRVQSLVTKDQAAKTRTTKDQVHLESYSICEFNKYSCCSQAPARRHMQARVAVTQPHCAAKCNHSQRKWPPTSSTTLSWPRKCLVTRSRQRS